MSEEIPDFPPIEFTPYDSQPVRLENLAAVRAYFQRQHDTFYPLVARSHAANQDPQHLFQQRFVTRYAQVNQYLNHAVEASDRFARAKEKSARDASATELRALHNHLLNSLKNTFSQADGAWVVERPDSQFVLELAKKELNEGAWALAHLIGAEVRTFTPQARNGIFKAQLFQAGITSLRGDAESQALQLIATKWTGEAEKLRTELETTRQEAKTLNEEHTAALKKHAEDSAKRAEDFASFIADQTNTANKTRAEMSDALEKLRETYNEHMKLLAPVEYWRKKKERHREEGKNLRLLTIAVGLVSFIVLGAYVFFNFDTDNKNVPWRGILGFFVLSSLAFWATKIFVRLLLSSIHQAEDAAEREVMAMTYMALVRGDDTGTKYLDPKDRALVLAPLFRPSAHGVIDDGAPPHVSELVTKLPR